jgi:DNA-binding beta-propeller fold protein YncE
MRSIQRAGALAAAALALALSAVAVAGPVQAASTFTPGPTLVLPSDGIAASIPGPNNLAISRSGTVGYVVTPDGGLRKLDLTKSPARTIGFSRNVAGTDLALSGDGRTAYVIDNNTSGIEVADVSGNTPRLLRTISTGSEQPVAIAASRDGKYVAYSLHIGFIADKAVLMSTARSRIPVAIRGLGAYTRIDADDVAFTPDSRSLLVGGEDSRLRIVGLSTRKIVSTIATRMPVEEIAVSPDSRYAYVAGGDGVVNKVDLNRHRRVAASASVGIVSAISLSLSPDATYLYVVNGDHVTVLAASSLRTVKTFAAFYPESVTTVGAGALRGTFFVLTSDFGTDPPPTLLSFRQSSIGRAPTELTVRFTWSPKGGAVKVGHQSTIRARPAGATRPYHYTWYHRGRVMKYQHSWRIVIKHVTRASAGRYAVRVNDASGWVIPESKWMKVVR